jgi:CHAD domain-containing protein
VDLGDPQTIQWSEILDAPAAPGCDDEVMNNSLLDVTGVGPATARLLAEAGFTTGASIANAEPRALMMVRGIGPARAASLRTAAQRVLAGDEPVSTAVASDGPSTWEDRAKKLRKEAKRTVRGHVGAAEDSDGVEASTLSLSGIARELELRAVDVPPVAPLPPKPAAGELVAHAIARSVADHMGNAPGVVLGTDSVALHHARVATRRLRSDLRTFEPILDSSWSRLLRSDLHAVAAVLGAVRDSDVLIGRFEESASQLPNPDGVDALVASLVETRTAQRAQLLTFMASSEYTMLLDRLVEAASNPALARGARSPVKKLNRLVRQPWRRLSKAVNRLPDDPPDEMLHEIRIHAKRARYAAEAAIPGVGQPARRFAKRAKHLQDVLGIIQDAAVAHEWLVSWSAGSDDRNAVLAAGQLAGLEIARRSAARAAWREAWRDLDRSKNTTWIK